ncbi:MAG: MATE family efflux transporter [Eubacteriales bacterium]
MKKESNILSTQSVPKLFITYAIPAVIAMIISGAQGMIDGMFIGNHVSSNALASVNIAQPFMHLIIGISMIISIGTQSYVGLNLGTGNKEKAQNCFHTFKIIIWISAAIVTILGSILNTQLANLLGADATLISDTSTYIKVISIFAIPMCTMFYFGFLNRIIGKPERYFYGSIISIIVNIFLDYLFIVRLDMGVMGAALATGTAYISALLFVVSPMLNKENVLNVFVGKFSTECIGKTLYNGSSEGINTISIAVTAFLFNTSLMQIAGAGGVAAFTAINYMGTFGGMLLFGISDGIGPIISYNFGTNDRKRVKQMMKIAYVTNFIFGMILFLLLFFAGEQLVGLFIKDEPALVELAVSGGKLYGIAFLMSGFNILNSGYFTFIGKGLESVIVAASRGLVFVSIGIILLPKFFDINGIWLSVPFAELCAVIAGLVLLRKTKI